MLENSTEVFQKLRDLLTQSFSDFRDGFEQWWDSDHRKPSSNYWVCVDLLTAQNRERQELELMGAHHKGMIRLGYSAESAEESERVFHGVLMHLLRPMWDLHNPVAAHEYMGEVQQAYLDESRRLERLSKLATLDEEQNGKSLRQAVIETPIDFPSLGKKEIAILNALAEAFPRLLINVEIEAATDLSKRTVCSLLPSLINAGYAIRPKGNRTGSTITEGGMKLSKLMRNP